MAGHMGDVRVTVQNLTVVKTDTERGLLMVKGAVPGAKGGWILLRDAVKRPLPDGLPMPAALVELAEEEAPEEVVEATAEAPAEEAPAEEVAEAAVEEAPVEEAAADDAATEDSADEAADEAADTEDKEKDAE